jgi:phenol 2-monooxygenase
VQFYLNGFYAGDPRVVPVGDPPAVRRLEEQDEVDVLIVGTGPAGLVLAAQLAQFEGVTTRRGAPSRAARARAGRWGRVPDA